MIDYFGKGTVFLAKKLEALGLIERRYPVTFQIVCYFKIERRLIEHLAPKGTFAYQLDAEHGVFYVTAMCITGGSVKTEGNPEGIAFDEILWGIRLRPTSRKPCLPLALAACALATSRSEAQEFLREKDHYQVACGPHPKLDFDFQSSRSLHLLNDNYS